MPSLSDEAADLELIRRAGEGDERAFERLVDRHYASCLRFALHMLGEREDAEEAVQDAFVRVWRALPEYEDRERFGGWLYRILVNCCRTLAARRQRRGQLVVADEALVAAAGSSGGDGDAGEWTEEVGRALARLPEAQREAFLLHHVEELSYEEMAVITGRGVSALKMRVSRACDRLRDLLTEAQSVR